MEEILYDNSLTNREKYQRIFGCDADRKKAQRALLKLMNGATPTSVVPPTTSTLSPEKVTMFADESRISERLLECTMDQVKDGEYLMIAHGYDPFKFKLVSASSSLWKQGTTEGGNTLFSSKITVRPNKGQESTLDLVEKFLKNYKAPVLNLPDYAPTKGTKAIEVCFADLHFGMEADELETGNEFNSEILSKTFSRVADNLVNQILGFGEELNTIVLSFIGDILDYDNAHKTTTAGTPRKDSGTFEKDYNIALESISTMIYNVLANSRCPIHIVYVPGNHDEILGYTIVRTIQAIFNNEKRITFDITQRSRKFVVFGKNLIGFTHGKMDKKRINQWLYQEAKEHISFVDRIEVHAGHLHHEVVEEENGVVVRYLPSITGKSRWDYDKGYKSHRNIVSFIWDAYMGLESINYIYTKTN